MSPKHNKMVVVSSKILLYSVYVVLILAVLWVRPWKSSIESALIYIIYNVKEIC